MKPIHRFTFGAAAALAAMATLAGAAGSNDTPAARRVGIYDSRAVAYAHFWSAEATRERNEAIRSARAAKAAGDTAAFTAKSRALSDHQQRMHEEVFSDAPAAEAMAALQHRLPALQVELGVTRLVSRWDEKALREVPERERVDVTERLIREFIQPDEQQRKVLDSMKTTEPVPRAKLREAHRDGGA